MRNFSAVFVVFVIAAVLCVSSTSFGADTSTGNLFVIFSAEHFAGLEVRMNADPYSNMYGAFGVNGLVVGLRISSKETRGLYINPKIHVNYEPKATIGLMVGWKTIVTNLHNSEFFVEAGVKNISEKPDADVNFGFALKF
ncbi:MAG TPA: hypothetical protein PK584_08865 [Fervidobacterium sp.]|nr:hypothetical protein [Fervidobacterium sp.]